MALTKLKSSGIADGAVTADGLATNAVTAADITDGSITLAKLSATGTAQAGSYLQGNNSWGAIASAGFNSMQFFDASGTWTKPSDITKVIIFVTGGGGGSGGGDNHGGAGGGGATIIRFINTGLGATETITIGAGGAGGSQGGGGSNGSAGSTTSFGSHATAGGGSGSSSNVPGAGSGTTSGAVSTVDIVIPGSNGTATSRGGGTFWGMGNYAASASYLTTNIYGCGASSSGPSSGAGKQGCVWVLEFK